MRLLVLTCVFGGYDRIFPPVQVDRDVDYVAVTDDPTLHVRGWRTHIVDASEFPNPRTANRYYKMLGHRVFAGYDASIYIDGNIRLRGSLFRMAQAFLDTDAALGVFPHPRRTCVSEEVEACISSGKVKDSEGARQELAAYIRDGLPENEDLVEAGVLLKRHNHPSLDSSMALWWSLIEKYQSRDQFSLPYVLWKSKLPCQRMAKSFREPDSCFGIYPHAGASGVSQLYVYVAARAYDSRLCRSALALWHCKWTIQRYFRRKRIASLGSA